MKNAYGWTAIIAGSRDLTNYAMFKSLMNNHILQPQMIATVISGGARGVDALGERYAAEYNINLIIMQAEWDRYGKSAGYKRNEEMAKRANLLIAWWDGQSRGTKHMIDIANKAGIKVILL